MMKDAYYAASAKDNLPILKNVILIAQAQARRLYDPTLLPCWRIICLYLQA